MQDITSFFSRLGQELLKRCWSFMAVIGFFAIVLKVNERLQFHDLAVDLSFFLKHF
jgi:hypothetical protein